MTTEIGEKETTAEERLRDRLGDRSDEKKNDEEKVEELFAASQGKQGQKDKSRRGINRRSRKQ